MKKFYLSLAVVFMVISALAKEQMKPKPINKSKTENTLNKTKDWGTDLFLGIVKLFLPVWGTYSEGGTTNRDIPLL
jgi:hypothetical protein